MQIQEMEIFLKIPQIVEIIEDLDALSVVLNTNSNTLKVKRVL